MRSLDVLVLSRIDKAYGSPVPGAAATSAVLRALSLRVAPGEMIAIAGAPGSGKTTLLLCAAGLLRPDSGHVYWPALSHRGDGRPAGIAYVSEHAPAYPFLTVRESLAYAVTVCELRAPGAARSTVELLDLAGLNAVADVRRALLAPRDRAGLLIALALVRSPRLLLVDNPLRAAAHADQSHLARALGRIAASGVGVVWAVESLRAAAPDCQTCVLLAGKLVRASVDPRPIPEPVFAEARGLEQQHTGRRS